MGSRILISTITVGSGGASSIVFSSIPQTYTHLKLVFSARTTNGGRGQDIFVRPNDSSTNGSDRYLYGSGETNLSTGTHTTLSMLETPAGGTTAGIFGNSELYITNYTGSAYKPMTSDTATENNGTYVDNKLIAGLWSNTSAITSLTIIPDGTGSIVQYSTASLYGMKTS
jgi:hypothetical protein